MGASRRFQYLFGLFFAQFTVSQLVVFDVSVIVRDGGEVFVTVLTHVVFFSSVVFLMGSEGFSARETFVTLSAFVRFCLRVNVPVSR